jgi:hypothetical protein
MIANGVTAGDPGAGCHRFVIGERHIPAWVRQGSPGVSSSFIRFKDMR